MDIFGFVLFAMMALVPIAFVCFFFGFIIYKIATDPGNRSRTRQENFRMLFADFYNTGGKGKND